MADSMTLSSDWSPNQESVVSRTVPPGSPEQGTFSCATSFDSFSRLWEVLFHFTNEKSNLQGGQGT